MPAIATVQTQAAVYRGEVRCRLGNEDSVSTPGDSRFDFPPPLLLGFAPTMPAVLALFAHPDDIEFRAAGTLLLLGARGWDLHYCNVSRGNLGSSTMSSARTATVRRKEAQAAAKSLGATWHPPFCDDLAIFYNAANLARVGALIRKVRPTILLTHPPVDYMEDHTETCRLAVSGAFTRGMPNFRPRPARAPWNGPVTIYHATPHGLRGPLREPVKPELLVNTASVHEQKLAALACHQSQQEWLDASQGMNSYLAAADEESRTVARLGKKLTHAEGWTRHSHLGFCGEADDPLREALGKLVAAPKGARE